MESIGLFPRSFKEEFAFREGLIMHGKVKLAITVVFSNLLGG